MSPEAGEMLLGQIAPTLRPAIPRVVHKVGCENDEELVLDALAMAAQLLDSVERHGKTVPPGNFAYYTILHMKSGRRSHTCGRTDVMHSATQLDQKSCVLSVEEEVGCDPELDEPIALGELGLRQTEAPARRRKAVRARRRRSRGQRVWPARAPWPELPRP